MEALLLERSAHPGLVRIIAHAVLKKASQPSGKARPQQRSANSRSGGKGALYTAELDGAALVAAPAASTSAPDSSQGVGHSAAGADAPTSSLAGYPSSMMGLNQQGTVQGLETGSSSDLGYSSSSSAGAGSGVQRFIRGFDSAIDSELDALFPPFGTGFKAPKGFEEGSTWLIMDFCDLGTLQVRQGSS